MPAWRDKRVSKDPDTEAVLIGAVKLLLVEGLCCCRERNAFFDQVSLMAAANCGDLTQARPADSMAMSAKKKKPPEVTSQLKGWAAIADFLKMPPATVQHWAKAGMPVKREGRSMVANPDELLAWLGHEARMRAPAQIATNTADLSSGLKESIAAAKKEHKSKRQTRR
jgi:hypothetical protein